jgi:hypothetical protein
MIKKHLKRIILLLAVIALMIGPIGSHVTYAAPVCDPGAVFSISNSFSLSQCFNDLIVMIGNAILTFVGLLVAVAGTLLDAVITYSVVDLKANIFGGINSSGSQVTGITVLTTIWGVMRDFVNISFIFILLYAAIKTILGAGSGSVKKILVSVVIAAVLINFSLFFTKLMIDGSNIVTLTFYNQIACPPPGTTCGGLSASLVNPLKMASAFDPNSGTLTQSGVNVFTVTILGSLLIIIAAFTLFAGAFMFIIRYVNIIFLLMFSAFGFFGSVLPGVGGMTKKWWDKLIGELLFAPIYMIILWAVVTIINSAGFLGSLGQGAAVSIANGLSSPSPNGMGLVMNFIIVIVLLNGVLIISKSIANHGQSVGQKLIGTVTGGAIGAAGWGGRKFIGGAGRSLADNDKLKDAASKSGVTGYGARLALRTSQRAAGATFDARNSTALSKMSGVTGFDMNKEFGFGKAGGKGGYDAQIKEEADKREKFAKSLGASDIQKDEAKRKLESEKEVVANAERDFANYDKRLAEQRALMDKETDPRRKSEFEEGIRNLEKEKGVKAEELKELKKNAGKRIGEAQKEVDRLHGVDEEEALKRIAKERKIEVEQLKKDMKKDADLKASIDAEVSARKVKSDDDKRKESYIDSLVNPKGIFGISSNRVGFIGPVSREAKQAVAQLRKGKKSVKDQLESILKESGEIKKPDEGGESEEAKPAPAPAPAPKP